MSATSRLRNEAKRAFHPLLNTWHGLAPQSRQLASGGSVLLCLALLWAFIWLPANRSRDQSTSQIPVLETKLAIMRTQAAEVARLTNIPPVAAKAGARVLADPAGLQTVFGPGAQISMTPPGHFRVTIASTPYGAWLEKLDQCLARYRLRIDAVTLTPRSGTGESTDISVELLLVDESAPAAAS